MDPITALAIASKAVSVAKDAWDIGSKICSFVQDVRKVDKTIEALSNEVKGLGNSCSMVHGRLETIVKEHGQNVVGQSQDLWACLDAQVDGCQKTISELKSLVPNIEKKTFFTKFKRQVEINFKAEDISEARERIRTNTLSLQTVLICIGIEVAYLTPKRVDQLLQTQLHELTINAEQLSEAVTRNNRNRNDVSTASTVLQVSSQIISSGETLYEASIAGGSIVSFAADKHDAVRGWIQEANSPYTGTADLATADDHLNHRLQSYLTDHVAMRTAPGGAIAGDSGLFDVTASTAKSYDAVNDSVKTSIDLDQDSDDDFTLDAAKQSIMLGRDAFTQNKWQEAHMILRETLQMLQELRPRQQKIFEAHDLLYMLGISAYHLDPMGAKAALVKLASVGSSDDADKIRACNASMCLAICCVQLGELEDAQKHCESARQGRNRLLGKDHLITHESIALLARIALLQGRLGRHRVLSTMLESHARGLDRIFDGLEVGSKTAFELHSITQVGGTLQVRSMLTSSTRASSKVNAEVNTTDQESDSTAPADQYPLPPESSDEESTAPPVKFGITPYDFRSPRLARWAQRHEFVYYSMGSVTAQERDAKIKATGINANFAATTAMVKGQDSLAKRLVSETATEHQPEVLHAAALFGIVPVLEELLTWDPNRNGLSALNALYTAKALSYAAESGSVAAVDLLLNENFLASTRFAPDGNVDEPLSVASLHGYIDIMESLLEYEAKTSTSRSKSRIKQKGTVLHHACAKGLLSSVATLHCYGMSLHHRSRMLATDLKVQFRWKSMTGFEPLDHIHLDPYGVAAMTGQLDVVRYLASCHVEKRAVYKTDSGVHGATLANALCLAAGAGQLEVVMWMLSDDSIDNYHLPALTAIYNDHEAVAYKLWVAGNTAKGSSKRIDASIEYAARQMGMNDLVQRVIFASRLVSDK